MATKRCCYLPEEIIYKVLVLVPVVSLVQCKLVCKLWLSIISNPQFIQTHLAISHKLKSSLMWIDTIPSDDDEDYPSCYFYDINCPGDTHGFTVRLDLPFDFACIKISLDPCRRILSERFIQTCNGLISIADINADGIYLLNPATTQMRVLPMCRHDSMVIWYLGFGFDSVSNDYKLLRVVPTHTSNEDWVLQDLVIEAELYSANDNCWKEIVVPEQLNSFEPSFYSNCVHAKPGVLYMDGDDEILSFDLHNEVFAVYPIHKDEKLLKISNVFDFEGSLAMMFKDNAGEGSVVSLWTLDDVSGNVCWIKKHNFEVALNIDWVLFYLGVGEFVTLNYDDGVIFYDYIRKETKKIPLLASAVGEVVSVVKYTESLVSLEGFQPLRLSGTFFMV